MRYRSFKEARKFVRTLGLKTQKEWFSFCKSGKKPDDIPITPYNIYKNKGWKSLGDWLGTGRIADQNKIFRDFVKARKFVRALKLKNQPDWSKYCKSGKKPADIPTTPERVYKNKGWKSLGDWLGTKNIANRYVVFRNFKDARKFARSLKLKSGREWQEYCESGKKPDDIPKSPDQAYKKEWKNWGDWLGNQNIQPQKRVFRDYFFTTISDVIVVPFSGSLASLQWSKYSLLNFGCLV